MRVVRFRSLLSEIYQKNLINLFISRSKLTILFFVTIFIALLTFNSLNTYDYLNSDGVMYLIQAHHINNDNYQLAYDIFPKVTYAKLIAITQSYLRISYLASANLLSNFFIALTLLVFFFTIFNISGSKYSSISSAIILINSGAWLDKYSPMVLRDHGYLFFLSLGFFFTLYSFYIISLSKKKLLFLFFGFIFFVISALFRIEGLLFTIIFFFALIKNINFHREKKILNKSFDYKKTILIIFIFLGFCFILFKQDNQLINYINSRFNSFASNLVSPIDLKSNDMWLPYLINNNNLLVKFSIIFGVFTFKFLIFIGIFYLFLIFVFFRSNQYLVYKNIVFISIMSLLPILLNFISTYVLSSRYFLGSLYLVMIICSLSLTNIFSSINLFSKKKKIIYFFIFCFSLFSFLDLCIDKKRINYEKNLAVWFLKSNIDTNTIYSDDERVDYYMNRFIHETERPQVDAAINYPKFKYFLIRNDNIFRENSKFREIIIDEPYRHKDIKVYLRNQ